MFDWSVLQESKITASATAPPAPHNKLSRLPGIHRVSLERHTNGEYAQKHKTMTTHFFGFFLSGLSEILPIPPAHALGSTVLRRRFASEFFENAIELRERLKSRGERDVTDAQTWIIAGDHTHFRTGCVRDVLDKVYAGYLLEIFAQIIRVHVDRFRDSGQGELFAVSVPRYTCALSKSRLARLGSGKSHFQVQTADNIFIIA